MSPCLNLTPESLVGRTPLVRLGRARNGGASSGPHLHAKLESRNPGGSVKDRAALAILQQALAEGRLGRGRTLLDATSGNTGIAFAMLGAALGFPVRLCLPENAGAERRRILAAYGAEVILTDAAEGSDGAIREARRLAAEEPDRYYYADRYSNPANWQAHYRTTGPEIWEQTGGRVTHFVAALGTTGTMMGVGRYLKERDPRIRLVAVQPESPLHGIEGLKHMETAMVPAIYDPAVIDLQETCSTEEAQDCAVRLAREEGLLVGTSSGAAYVVARRIAAGLTGGEIVAIFPDAGDRYLSERFWTGSAC